ncbi:hypothetical protein Hamer_G001124 [Homarus americanus]|uniref:Uncharacterized protein n=1 Tax=Homarus americanus TaxID=6706 RepID=A0A8J5T2H9_HOMAM|nr:hypothetical protein Hamer_G001124 [Homarus americanus]
MTIELFKREVGRDIEEVSRLLICLPLSRNNEGTVSSVLSTPVWKGLLSSQLSTHPLNDKLT